MRLILPVLLAAALASAQTHQDQITVNVVEVPVYVERFTGSAVAGLKKEDFKLYVNGRPQLIHYFDVLDEEATTRNTSLNRRRLIVLLFNLSAPAWAHWRQKGQAAQFVARAAPGDAFAVATIGRSDLRFVVPFTMDRVAVQRAISTLTPSAARDPFGLATLEQERSVFAGAESATGTPADIFGTKPIVGPFLQGSRAAQPLPDGLSKLNQAETDVANRTLIDGLGKLADLMAPLTGVKHVLLLSGGSVGEIGFDLFQLASRMHARYRSAGVVLDIVDAVSPRAPWGVAEASRGSACSTCAFGPNPSLYLLAVDTGGVVTTSLASLQKMLRVTYILGFHPEGPQKRRNEIRVRVKKAAWGTFVRHRRSYSVKSKDDSGKDDGLFLADTLVNDIPQNGMTVDVIVNPEGEKAELSASVPGRELLAYPADKPLLLDVFLYVFNDRNLVADWSYVRISLDLNRGHDFLSSNPYTVRKEFDLQPGRYAAKALVQVVGTDVTGFRRTDFQISQP